MAPSFFNKMSKNHISVGAGTNVGEHEGEPLHQFVVQCMNELGHDLSKNTRKQLTPEMVNNADKIIVMTEKENLPDYIDMSKVVFWEIDDAKDKSLEFHLKIRDQIKKLVEKLVIELE